MKKNVLRYVNGFDKFSEKKIEGKTKKKIFRENVYEQIQTKETFE